jgi:DNA-binding transcriptional MerR regulator
MRQRGVRSRRHRNQSKKRSLVMTRQALCAVCQVAEKELLTWEHEELLTPVSFLRTANGLEPLYGGEAVERIRLIRTLAYELDVNLPGIGVILGLLERLHG